MPNELYKAGTDGMRDRLKNHSTLLTDALRGSPVGGVGPNGYTQGADVDRTAQELAEALQPFGYTQAGAGIQEALACEHLYVISASILDFALQDGVALESYAMRVSGMPSVPSVNTTWANRGDDTPRYLAKLPDALADAEGKENVVFLIHGFGNDITANGPWPGGRDAYEAAMRSMTNDIHDAGHKAVWCSVSYRRPGGSNPSAPYNLNLQRPVVEEIAPESFGVDGHWLLDMYDVMYSIRDYGFRDDNVHPNDRGNSYVRARVAMAVRDAMYPDMAGKTTPDELYGKRLVFQLGSPEPREFTAGINAHVPNHEPGNAVDAVTGHGATTGVYDTAGNFKRGVWLEAVYSNTNSEGATGGTSEPGVTAASVVSTSIFVHPEDVPGRVIIRGLPNGLTGRLKFSAARNSTATDRFGVYQHKNQSLELDGAWQAGDDVAVGEFNFTVEDGELELNWEPAAGSEYAYVNAVELEFDPAVPV